VHEEVDRLAQAVVLARPFVHEHIFFVGDEV